MIKHKKIHKTRNPELTIYQYEFPANYSLGTFVPIPAYQPLPAQGLKQQA